MKSRAMTTGNWYRVWNIRAYPLHAHFLAAYGEQGTGSGSPSCGSCIEPDSTMRQFPISAAAVSI